MAVIRTYSPVPGRYHCNTCPYRADTDHMQQPGSAYGQRAKSAPWGGCLAPRATEEMVRLTATARATEAMEDDKKKKRAGQTQTKGRLTVYLPTSAETATTIRQLGGPPVCCGSERLPGDAAPGARGKGKEASVLDLGLHGATPRRTRYSGLPCRGVGLP